MTRADAAADFFGAYYAVEAFVVLDAGQRLEPLLPTAASAEG